MAALGSLLGGLQSAKNPGVNMTPGAHTYRRSRLGIPLKPGAWTGRPGTGMAGVIGGVRTTAVAAPTVGSHAIPGGPRPTAPAPPAGYRPPPAAPGTTTTTPPPAGPSLLQFDQWLATQPLWIQQQANDVATQNSLMSGYGFYKDATGHLIADPTSSPDSVIAQEDLSRQRGIGHTAQQGANHGNLFSGASLIGVQNANDAYRAGAAKALRELEGKLGDITQRELDTKIGMGADYADYVGNTQTAQAAATKTATDKAAADAARHKAAAEAAARQAARTAAMKKRKRRKPPAKPPKQRQGGGLGVNQGGGSIARGGG